MPRVDTARLRACACGCVPGRVPASGVGGLGERNRKCTCTQPQVHVQATASARARNRKCTCTQPQ
eukprot:2973033-Rhodomonas_salina.1